MSLDLPERCPRCNATDTLFISDAGRLTCRLCGYRGAPAPDTSPTADAMTYERARRYVVSYSIEHRGEVHAWTRASYHTGLDHVRREEYEEAIRAFQRTLAHQHDFIDAHLWIARLSHDPETKRHHYSYVIAHMPNHQEAIRELMVLNGQLTPDENARVADASHDPERVRVTAPVSVDAQDQVCPLCGGEMRGDINAMRSECVACGHVVQHASDRGYGLQSVSMALMKRRGQTIVWDVGEHIWHCDHCGADQIIQGKMARRCPFCGSSQVMRIDALGSFQQPDSLLPFHISEREAKAQVWDALNTRLERFKGLFVQNKVANARLQATFIPMWYFDAVIDINLTITPRNTYHRRTQIQRETLKEMAHDVGIPGVDSPPRYLLQRIDDYNLKSVRPYETDLLAGYHAQLYTRDFERAMFMARRQIGDRLRAQYRRSTMSDADVNVNVLFQQMFFRLVMLPVYTVTLVEVDGDIRPAVVNGQTGTTALGRAEKVD